MQGESGRRSGVLQYVVVLVVGVVVATVVLGLNLIPRLSDGQNVLDAARPAFAPERLSGARAGIDIISTDVDMADPIATSQGTAAAEVPQLIAFVAEKTGLAQAEVVAALQTNFPHTTALLQAIPLSSVTEELPALFAFLEKNLGVSEAELLAALRTSFPGLAQAITNLPTVTIGWNDIANMDGATRFDGTPIKTVPDLRTYFSSDLIPVLETQQDNFNRLDGTSAVNWIAPLLLIVGLVVIAFAVAMIALNLRGSVSRGLAKAGAVVVLVVGVGVVALVLAMSLIPRVGNGQTLLDALRPVNDAARVQGDRAGIEMVSAIVDMEDPIMTAEGGAAAEVPQLIAFVAEKIGLSQAEVVAALKANFPHTTALLQAITNLPAVTGGWNDVPDTNGATRFDGTPIKTVADVRTYFSSDVIPVLETQQNNYENLVSISKIDFIGYLVLAVGIIVIIYGVLMLLLARRLEPSPRSATGPAPSPAT
jgi:uncharacterized protein YidB (DUF937 family)